MINKKRLIFVSFAILIGIVIGYYITTQYIAIDSKGAYFNDDEFIVSAGDSHSYFKKTGEINDLEFTNFSGTETVYSTDEAKTITLTINTDINKGEFKVVFINPENEISILTSGEYTYTLDGGLYRIKIVGNKASGSYQLNILE